jgi:HEAT repeat protein
MADSVLKRTAEGSLLDGLLAAMWDGRDTTVARDILACLQPMKAYLVPSLIRALGVESRSGARAMLCDVLLALDGDRIDDLGPYVSDSRWYLVRNVVSVLGRTRNSRAVAYLGQLVRHPDYRVRRETVNALSAIGTEEAQGVIASFLDDQDERIRLRALQSMDSWEAWRAMPKILAVLRRPDPFLKQFDLKQAALEALARLGAKQSLPAVRKVAGTWFLFGARARELRRLAELTAAIIEGQEPLPERGFGALAGRERHGP